MDTLPFYIFLFVHLTSLIVGFGAVLVTDFFGFLWMRKKINISTVQELACQTEKLIWLGWCGLVASGIGLITIKGYVDNLTVIKLFFVAMIGLNGIYLRTIKKTSERLGDGPMPGFLKFRIGLATAISQLGWWGALSIGFVHRHWKHTISWPENPWAYIGIISFVIIFAAVVGELALKSRSMKPNSRDRN